MVVESTVNETPRDFVDDFLVEWEERAPNFRDLRENAGMYRVLRVSAFLDQEIDQLARAHGLRAGQFQALAALRRLDPKPLSASELGRSSILTSGTITVLLDRLEKMRLVIRRPHPVDRRSVQISLTAEGRKRVDKILAARTERLANLMDLLSKAEKKVLSSSLRKILVRLEADRKE